MQTRVVCRLISQMSFSSASEQRNRPTSGAG